GQAGESVAGSPALCRSDRRRGVQARRRNQENQGKLEPCTLTAVRMTDRRRQRYWRGDGNRVTAGNRGQNNKMTIETVLDRYIDDSGREARFLAELVDEIRPPRLSGVDHATH